MYKTELLKDIRFPKDKYIDDEYWTYKLFANAKKITWINKVLYYYRQHEESTMGRMYSIKRLDAIDALYDRYKFMQKNFPNLSDLSCKAFLNNCIYNFQKLCMFNELDNDKKFREDLLKKIRQIIKREKINNLNVKEKLLFYFFCKYPYIVSKIRNTLGRGV